jgi:PAP2 superfamily
MKKIALLVTPILLVTLFSCQKEIKTSDQQQSLQNVNSRSNDYNGHLKQTNTYTADVVKKWINMQLRLMRITTGVANNAFTRHYAYAGIALYESVVPGMPAYQSIASQLNGLSGLPQTQPGFAYHWPTSANAALAFINKNIFPATTNKAAIGSLEAALNTQYADEVNSEVMSRSITFGKSVAQKIFDWAQTDGYLLASNPYTAPVGTGLWVPTPPAFAAASTPYWGNLRTIVPGSGENAQPGPPTSYSENPSSDFYKMAKKVYDVSLTLTHADSAMALFWRDVPGVTSPGHWESVLLQVLEKDGSMLDKAAVAYAFSGIAGNDALISNFKAKYFYHLVRPVTYIRTVLGHPTWSSLLTTPGHPEYPSAHAALSAATAEALTIIFGENYSLTDHTYDYFPMATRTYSSLRAIGEDAGNSRLYAGIHYQPSIDVGFWQGTTVAKNIVNKLKFLK